MNFKGLNRILGFQITLTLLIIGVVHVVSARELELYLGHKMLNARHHLSSTYSQRTSADVADSLILKKAIERLRGEFEAIGGVDILGESSGIRWAWLSSNVKSWILQLNSSRKRWKQVESNLVKAGWSSNTDGTLRYNDYLAVLGDGKILISRHLALEEMKRESLNWSLPLNDWFSLRLDSPFFYQVGVRSPRIEAFASNITEMYASWEMGDLVLNVQLKEPSQATTVLVALNGAISMAKGAVVGNAQSPRSSLQMFDFLAYSSQKLHALAFEQTLNRFKVESFGRILQIRYTGAGDLDRFLLESLPRMIGLGLIAAAPLYVKYKDQLPSLLNLPRKDISSERMQGVSDGDSGVRCLKEAKMIQQAVEFYNLDHLKKGKFENIKKDLFENGYLPANLSCAGRSVKDFDDFGTDSEGKIFLKSID